MKKNEESVSLSYKIRRFFELFKYIRHYKLRFLMLFVLSGLSALLSLAPTYIMKPLTDTVFVPSAPMSTAARMHMLNMLILALMVAYAMKTILDATLSYQKKWLAEQVGVDVRKSAFVKLHTLSMKYFNSEKAGTLESRINYDTMTINYFLTYDLVDLFVALLTLTGMWVILICIRWKLALMLLMPLPFLIFLARLLGERMLFVFRLLHQKMANLSSIIFNSIIGAAIIKINSAERKEVARFNRASHDLLVAKMQATKAGLFFDPVKGFFIFACATFIYWLGGTDVIKQRLTLGELMVFIGYMWQFYSPVEEIASAYTRFQNFIVASQRVAKITDAEPDIHNKANPVHLHDIRGSIKLDNVSFSYDGRNITLENINLEINPGEVIGVTGPSGAGKSTLNLLLFRLYDVPIGSVLVDGYNVKDVSVTSLRKQMGLVLQDTWLFFGTIAENIAYGKFDASQEEIITAAKAAGAHNYIMMLPDAYDTHIGEGGVGLSGGERQRIAIARVLLKNAKIIIFDEATSAVDSETEAFIQKTIAKLAGKHTIIIVSHRLSLLKNTDKIIVLDKGKIVEAGSFDQLKNQGSLFSRLHQVQEI